MVSRRLGSAGQVKITAGWIVRARVHSRQPAKVDGLVGRPARRFAVVDRWNSGPSSVRACSALRMCPGQKAAIKLRICNSVAN